MKTRVLKAGQICLSLTFLLTLTACNQDDFYQKEFLENPYQEEPKTNGSVVGGGQTGGDGGVTGGTSGGTSGGSTTGGTDGSATGGNSGGDDGSSAGGTDGGDDGSSTGGTDGSAAGGTDGGGVPSVDCDVTPEHQDCKTEMFQQSSSVTKKLDIVWIIDNSGSMADEQEDLGVNFNAFIQDFITKDVDFKMGITTTDARSSYKGLMVAGSESKLNSAAARRNESQFMNDFRQLVKVGTRGSGSEKGLEASEGFMNRYAHSFLREDAYLAVVVLSDEEDQSYKSVKTYTDYLKSFKQEAGLVKLYSIVDVTRSNCCSSGVTTGYERYAQASAQTGGEVYDIREDFGLFLSQMGDSLVNLLDSFALGGNPVPGTVKVFVNGEQVSGWTYDSVSRSVKFNVNHVPEVGAEIVVKYQQQ